MPTLRWFLGYQLAALPPLAVDLATIWCADSADARAISRHLCIILLAAGTALGLSVGLLDRLARLGRLPARLWVPLVSAVPLYLTGKKLFSGGWIARQSLAPIGPAIFMFLCVCALGLCMLLTARFQHRRPRAVILGWAVLGAALLATDRLALSGLYPRLHDALALAAWLCWGYAAASLVDRALRRAPETRRRTMFVLVIAALAASSLPISFARAPNFQHRQLLVRYGGAAAQVYDGARQLRIWYQGRQLSESAYAEPIAAWVKDTNAESRYDEATTRARWQRELNRRGPQAPAHATAGAVPANVVLITVDTLRADVEAATRQDNGLAGFSRDALRFSRAYASSASTRISLPVLTTGRFDGRDGEGNVIQKLRSRGYDTVVVMSKIIYTWLEFQDQAWLDDAERVVTPDGQQGWLSTAVTKAAQSIVTTRAQDKPLFLWVHYSDVHDWPLMRDSAGDQASSRSVYEDTWARESAQVMSLLSYLKRVLPEDRTSFIFASDHGELLGEHGQLSHGRWLYEEVVRVPLWVLTPGRPGRAIDHPVGLVDVAPTIADITGLPFDDFDGVSLLRPIAADRLLVMGEQYEIGAVRGALRIVFTPAHGALRLLDESKPNSLQIGSPDSAAMRDLLEPLLGSPYARRGTTPLDP